MTLSVVSIIIQEIKKPLMSFFWENIQEVYFWHSIPFIKISFEIPSVSLFIRYFPPTSWEISEKFISGLWDIWRRTDQPTDGQGRLEDLVWPRRLTPSVKYVFLYFAAMYIVWRLMDYVILFTRVKMGRTRWGNFSSLGSNTPFIIKLVGTSFR